MPIVRIIAGGFVSGILANATGYLITGRLFHPYQARTPNTWRQTESSEKIAESWGELDFAGLWRQLT